LLATGPLPAGAYLFVVEGASGAAGAFSVTLTFIALCGARLATLDVRRAPARRRVAARWPVARWARRA
jgi:hypothetical protein